MKIISLDLIKGNEVLSKDVYNETGTVLVQKGTTVRKEYVMRLRDQGVEFVYVEDELLEGVELDESLEIKIKEQCQGSVKDIIEKYSYQSNMEKKEITYLINEIMKDVLEEAELLYSLYSIRDKSEEIYSHSLNVSVISIIVALKMGISEERIKEIAQGALLHDIGYVYLSESYRDMYIETASQDEREVLMRHVIYGYEIVQDMDWISETAKDIILKHHEREDDSGYPFGLKSDRVSLECKIVALCNEFDSRVYGNIRKRNKVGDVIDDIMAQAEVKFDIKIVEALVASVAVYPTASFVETNDGQKGVVVRQNAKCPTRPVIKILKDKKGKIIAHEVERDLTKELTLFIKEIDSIDD